MKNSLKKIKYIFDFDGTIVDVWNRYYAIFEGFYSSMLSKNEYIQFRRTMTDRELIKFLKLKNEKEFFEYKKERIEKLEFLSMDTLLVDKEKLHDFFVKNNCIVLTSRRNERNYQLEIEKLGLSFLKESSIVIEPSDKSVKKTYVLTNRENFDRTFYIVGDSETDLEIGKITGCKTYFVESGLGKADLYKKYRVEKCELNHFLDKQGESYEE